MHKEKSEYAGKTVVLKPDRNHPQGNLSGEFVVEDWWDNISEKPWSESTGNVACTLYAFRAGYIGLPPDNEVLYGKSMNGLGDLIHVSEIKEVKEE